MTGNGDNTDIGDIVISRRGKSSRAGTRRRRGGAKRDAVVDDQQLTNSLRSRLRASGTPATVTYSRTDGLITVHSPPGEKQTSEEDVRSQLESLKVDPNSFNVVRRGSAEDYDTLKANRDALRDENNILNRELQTLGEAQEGLRVRIDTAERTRSAAEERATTAENEGLRALARVDVLQGYEGENQNLKLEVESLTEITRELASTTGRISADADFFDVSMLYFEGVSDRIATLEEEVGTEFYSAGETASRLYIDRINGLNLGVTVSSEDELKDLLSRFLNRDSNSDLEDLFDGINSQKFGEYMQADTEIKGLDREIVDAQGRRSAAARDAIIKGLGIEKQEYVDSREGYENDRGHFVRETRRKLEDVQGQLNEKAELVKVRGDVRKKIDFAKIPLYVSFGLTEDDFLVDFTFPLKAGSGSPLPSYLLNTDSPPESMEVLMGENGINIVEMEPDSYGFVRYRATTPRTEFNGEDPMWAYMALQELIKKNFDETSLSELGVGLDILVHSLANAEYSEVEDPVVVEAMRALAAQQPGSATTAAAPGQQQVYSNDQKRDAIDDIIAEEGQRGLIGTRLIRERLEARLPGVTYGNDSEINNLLITLGKRGKIRTEGERNRKTYITTREDLGTGQEPASGQSPEPIDTTVPSEGINPRALLANSLVGYAAEASFPGHNDLKSRPLKTVEDFLDGVRLRRRTGGIDFYGAGEPGRYQSILTEGEKVFIYREMIKSLDEAAGNIQKNRDVIGNVTVTQEDLNSIFEDAVRAGMYEANPNSRFSRTSIRAFHGGAADGNSRR
jgi:hypothetical protein